MQLAPTRVFTGCYQCWDFLQLCFSINLSFYLDYLVINFSLYIYIYIAVGSKDETQPKLPRIKFPPACDSEARSMLDYAISKKLDKKLGKKKYNQRLNESGLVIYEVWKEIFGVKETINKPPAKENRRQRMMKALRNKKKNLKKQLRLANCDVTEGLLEIWQDLKEKHNALSSAENQRKRRVKRRKEQGHFFQEPYKYARNIFDKPKSGVLKTEKYFLKNI